MDLKYITLYTVPVKGAQSLPLCIYTKRYTIYFFFIFSDPTPHENDPLLQIKWDPVVDANNLNYLSIGSELTKGKNPFYERMLFWEKLHHEHIFLRTLVYFNEMGVTW